MPNDQLPEIYNRYEFYILSSFFEGMPKTLLEAMACGCICIGTDVEGINEVIEDGISGLLAKGTEVESIAEVLKRAMRLNEEESKKMAQEARRKIEEDFSLESCVVKENKIFMLLRN